MPNLAPLLTAIVAMWIESPAAAQSTPPTAAPAPAFAAITSTNFATAERAAIESGRDLLVLVGASWCGPCHTVRDQVIPEIAAQGGLARLEFAWVDFDEQTSLARALMHGNTVPQIIYLRHDGNRWNRLALIPQQADAAKVLEMIRWVQALPPPVRPAPMLPPGNDFVPGSARQQSF